jgi:hypothetical protein
VAINGADGIPAFTRIDESTSMGFPLCKAKKNFMRDVDLEHTNGDYGFVAIPREFVGLPVADNVRDAKTVMLEGERPFFIFKMSMKDEPLTTVKIGKHKIRIFLGFEVVGTLVSREFYLGICRLFRAFPLECETAVGINACGPEWDELIQKVLVYGPDRIFAGDYQSYDKMLRSEVMAAAFRVYMRIAVHSENFDDNDLAIMRGIMTEICYPVYEVDGVFLQFSGTNPSGHTLTVEINGTANSLLKRMCYYKIHIEALGGSVFEPFDHLLSKIPPFHERVTVVNYGDDDMNSVHPDEKLFNHRTYSQHVQCFGMTYTDADKTMSGAEFTPFSQLTFLKRRPLWDDELQTWLAPLDIQSVCKSLMMTKEGAGGDFASEAQLAADAVDTAQREMFQYGRKQFDSFKEKAARLVVNVKDKRGVAVAPLCKAPFMSYDDLASSYRSGTLEPWSAGPEPQEDLEGDIEVQSGCVLEYEPCAEPFLESSNETVNFFWWEWYMFWLNAFLAGAIWSKALYYGDFHFTVSPIQFLNWKKYSCLYFVLFYCAFMHGVSFLCVPFMFATLCPYYLEFGCYLYFLLGLCDKPKVKIRLKLKQFGLLRYRRVRSRQRVILEIQGGHLTEGCGNFRGRLVDVDSAFKRFIRVKALIVELMQTYYNCYIPLDNGNGAWTREQFVQVSDIRKMLNFFMPDILHDAPASLIIALEENARGLRFLSHSMLLLRGNLAPMGADFLGYFSVCYMGDMLSQCVERWCEEFIFLRRRQSTRGPILAQIEYNEFGGGGHVPWATYRHENDPAELSSFQLDEFWLERFVEHYG